MHNILLNSGLLSEYRLRSREIGYFDAMDILRSKNPRPIIATFYLSASEWNSLSNYFSKYPNGILCKEDLKNYYNPNQKSTAGGHAIIIMDANLSGLPYFNIANSWEDNWANKGFFKVLPTAIEFRFYDVYWYETDLTREERKSYIRAIIHKIMIN